MALVLGYSAYFHDSSACIIQDGVIIAAAAEERFTRIKHDASFPEQAIRFCLERAEMEAKDLDAVVYYEKPFTKLDRILDNHLQVSPSGFSAFRRFVQSWLKEKFWVEDQFRKRFKTRAPFSYYRHHLSHVAATALMLPSHEPMAFLVIDGVGEKACTSFGVVENGSLKVLGEQYFPHSIGLLYSAFTYYCGFKVNSGEYKLMGLAPYGKPIYRDLIFQELVSVGEDGVVRLQMDKFGFTDSLTMINRKFESIFKKKARKPEEGISDFYKDIAASIQLVTEELILTVMRYVQRETGAEQLIYAGGVALNCVANAKITEETAFSKIHIPSAAGDSGCAIGAASWKADELGDTVQCQDSDYVGPAFSKGAVLKVLQEHQLKWHNPGLDVYDEVAGYLAANQIVGWFHGAMELGPRALGNRSILANPTHPDMKRILNEKIKKREGFRPFAPVVLDEHFEAYFVDAGYDYSTMLYTTQTTPKAAEIPACVHLDGSARVQRLKATQNEPLHHLLKAFEKRTGCPVLINTSFNERGEPMVCTPEDALNCFWNTEIDVLVLEGMVVLKSENAQKLNEQKRRTYAAD